MDGDDAMFAVCIRSLLHMDNELTLFAGAGIVSGSDATQEWEELNSKIALPLSVLL